MLADFLGYKPKEDKVIGLKSVSFTEEEKNKWIEAGMPEINEFLRKLRTK